jgi:hypothetical protein
VYFINIWGARSNLKLDESLFSHGPKKIPRIKRVGYSSEIPKNIKLEHLSKPCRFNPKFILSRIDRRPVFSFIRNGFLNAAFLRLSQNGSDEKLENKT